VKKVLVFALLLGILLTGAVMAEENNVKVNVAASYYPATFYATDFSDYNMSCIMLEGNLFVGKDKKWKGSIEYYGGSDTKNALKLEANSVTGRVGYDFWQHTYFTVDYKSTQLKLAGLSNTFNGLGFGLEKDFQLGPRVPVLLAVHYYPTFSGPRSTNFRVWEYEAQVKYQIPNAVDVFAGYKAENWDGYDNASGINAGFRGPVFGVSKEF
jgi:hypothetical protein